MLTKEKNNTFTQLKQIKIIGYAKFSDLPYSV